MPKTDKNDTSGFNKNNLVEIHPTNVGEELGIGVSQQLSSTRSTLHNHHQALGTGHELGL